MAERRPIAGLARVGIGAFSPAAHAIITRMLRNPLAYPLSRNWRLAWQSAGLLVCLWLAGCRAAPPVTPSATPLPSLTHTPIILPSSTPPPTQPPTSTPLPSSTPAAQLCSPLEGFVLADLPGLISNPFHPPPPGSDDPHQGVDLAVQQYGMAVTGRPVRAVLAGQVAAVIADRFPYGNALIIETRLENLPPGLLAPLPTLAPTLPPHPALTCPPSQTAWDLAHRSLYLLYGHMQAAPTLQPDDEVTCGTQLGVIGQSGNALNPHLHIEARLGPAGARPGSLAHYDSSASPEEMSAYCTWRVSGVFQLVDPMGILK